MEQRGADQPGHEGSILHRGPIPPAAPAELVIGPPASQRDAGGEKGPGDQGPGADPARPGGVDLALDQRRDGEGEGDGEADIRSEEHTSELQSLMRSSSAVFCVKKKKSEEL